MLQLHLWHDFYNLIFKTGHKLCIASRPVPHLPMKNSECAPVPFWFNKDFKRVLVTSHDYPKPSMTYAVFCVWAYKKILWLTKLICGFIWISEGAPKVQAPKIVNGFPATTGQFPHQGALLIDGGTFCGCSLLSEIWVLTAAHCAQGSVWTVMLQGPSSFILNNRVSNST
jgi:hypothetical protein